MMKLKGKVTGPLVTEPLDTETKTFVFVYGTLRSGHGNNRLLRQGNARLIGTAETRFPMYRLYARGIPFMVPEYTSGNGVKVKGEVWEVDAACLQRLDWLEGHPRNYTRKTIEVMIWNRETFRDITVQAEVYLYLHQDRIREMNDIGDEYTG